MDQSWMYLLAHWVVSAVALMLTAALVPGFRIRGFLTAMVAALFIAFANFYLRPVLIFLSIPFILVTLGLFIFVVDAIILRLCAAFMANFEISNWFSAFFGAMILTVTSMVLHFVFV